MNLLTTSKGILPAFFILALMLIMTASCGIVPQKQLTAEQDSVNANTGEVIEKGKPLFYDADGNTTAEPVAADGKPNLPVDGNDIAKVEEKLDQAKKIGEKAPIPFAWLVAPILGGIAAVSVPILKRQNKKKLADGGLQPKGKNPRTKA